MIPTRLSRTVLALTALVSTSSSLTKGAVHEVLQSFGNPPQSPSSGDLAAGPGGSYWGTTENGGASSCGTIYKIDPATGVITTVVNFSGNLFPNKGSSPRSKLVSDGGDFFWGTTSTGGSNFGTVFKVNANTGVLTTLASFSNNGISNKGANPQGGLLKDGGFFWGITNYGGPGDNGTVFKIDAATGTLTTVISFTGSSGANKGSVPQGGLTRDGSGLLWGTTGSGGSHGNGTVFKIDPASGSLTTVLEFTGDDETNAGSNPQAALTWDGTTWLWGTTQGGGEFGKGTVFKIEAATGTLETVISFTGDGETERGQSPCSSLAWDGAGSFWGTTRSDDFEDYGTIYKIDPVEGTMTTVLSFTRDGESNRGSDPAAGLIATGTGKFIGTTRSGGASDIGTIFQIDIASGELTTLVECERNKGTVPLTGLVADADGKLWGTTENGGSEDDGTLFKFDPVTGGLLPQGELLSYSTGSKPRGALVADGLGYYWGTSRVGGENNAGTIFKIDATTGEISTMVSFSPFLGVNPYSGLTADGAGCLWGTTYEGGSSLNGTIFKIDAATGDFTPVLSFTNNGGSNKGRRPVGGLTADGHGYLWGTTFEGGASSLGTVYKVSIETGELTTLASFTSNGSSNRGARPQGRLAYDSAGGFMWGTASLGDTVTLGTVFKVDVATGVLTTLFEFTGTAGSKPGANPLAGLTADGAGNFWGVTSAGGASNFGTIFKVAASTGTFTSVMVFTGTGAQANSGATPVGDLLLHTDGHLYGTTAGGGPGGLGTLFRLRLGASPFETWQVTHFGSTAVADAADDADPDGDGTLNATEFRLGLNPKDGTSAFKAAGSRDSGGYTLTWQSVAGVSVQVQRSISLHGDWETLATLTGVGTYTDANPPQGSAFYRLKLVP